MTAIICGACNGTHDTHAPYCPNGKAPMTVPAEMTLYERADLFAACHANFYAGDRQWMNHLMDFLRAAVESEREAVAQMVDNALGVVAEPLSTAIRARGSK